MSTLPTPKAPRLTNRPAAVLLLTAILVGSGNAAWSAPANPVDDPSVEVESGLTSGSGDEGLVPSEVGAESPSAGPEAAAPPVVSVPEVVAPAPAPAAAPAPAPAPVPAPAAAAVVPVRSVLLAGESLWPGEVLTSANGLYRGVLQSDGNFGVFGPSGVLWASMTPGSGARVSVQSDGNVGFFSSSRVLATNTGGSGDGHRLVMQDDGNLALYSLGGVVIWSSMGGRTGNTRDSLASGNGLWPGQELVSTNGAYRGVLQGDGNFGIYGPSGVVWASMTSGSGARVSVQSDGNVGFFSSTRVFATTTGGTGDGHRLVMQGDGNLGLYSVGGVSVWSSKFGRTGNARDSLASGNDLWPGQELVSTNGAYRGVLQGDGNFGIYGPSGVVWASMTSGSRARVSVQSDGNVGFFSSSRVLATGTGGTGPGNHLVMQGDGNLGLWSSAGNALWSSRYGRTPTTPQVVTTNGFTWVDGTLIVNKSYSLPSWYNPGLLPETSNAFAAMQAEARQYGLSLFIRSGFRSYSTQASLYAGYVRAQGVAAADSFSARPGFSEHQSGLSFDVNSTSGAFAYTAEGRWVASNAHRFGFIVRYPAGKQHITGYIYEPWHLRYVGSDLANRLYSSGQSLEEYFGLSSSY